LSVGIVAAAPLTVVTEPGAATNDVAMIALLVAAVALLIHGSASPKTIALAGVAGGLAIGTKFSALAPVAAVTFVGVLFPPRLVQLELSSSARRRGRVAWFGALGLVGGFWYVRNLIRVGNPVPSVAIPGLPRPNDRVFTAIGHPVSDFVTRRWFWRDVVRPGLARAIGPGWLVLGVLSVVAMVVALIGIRGASGASGPADASRDWSRRLAAAALVSGIAYIFTPYSAGGAGKDLFLFAPDVRFAYPALAFALLALVAWATASPRHAAAVNCLLAVALMSEQLGRHDDYVAWLHEYWGAAVATAAIAVVALGVFVFAGPAARRVLAIAGLASAVSGLGAVRNIELAGRYTTGSSWSPIYTWARSVHHSHIAVVGVPLQYPLFGTDISNRVVYAGRPEPHGNLDPLSTCEELREQLMRLHADFLVVGPSRLVPPGTPEIGWARSFGAQTVLVSSLQQTVLRLGPSIANGCAGDAPG
jgi:hypothetical protein